MMSNEVIRINGNARIKFRSDTLENWQNENPVLLSGEPGVVIDGIGTEKIKFGDGSTPWNNLTYWVGPKGEKGNRGPQGEKGDKGEDGKDAQTEQVYNPNSEKALSCKAISGIIGDIEIALDTIISIQNNLIGGNS